MKSIYFDGKYENYLNFKSLADDGMKRRVEIAAEQLRFYINLDYDPQDFQLVIIKVGGYDCVAVRSVKAEIPLGGSGVPIYELVSPFDETRVYPIQCAELKLEFKLY